ncbi:hypothetical protein LSAT2_018269 [Lamellibrachia satsuma]|nr:hypothetical protein LSAT2_018269 [Lamellibrachia satsuma]
MAPAAKRRKCTRKFQNEWLEKFGGMIVPSKSGEQYVRCSLCSRDVKVAASDLYDVNEHIKSNLHKVNLKNHDEGATVRAFFKLHANCSDATNEETRAQVIFTYFIA